MYQFEKLPIWMLSAQLFNHPEAHAATTMHRNSGRLVDNDKGVVLEQNLKRDKTRFTQFLPGRRSLFSDSYRWYANDISQLPPELLRKGRLDEIFFVDLPDADAATADDAQAALAV